MSVLVAPPPVPRPVARPSRPSDRTTLTDAAASFAAALVNHLVADGVPFSKAAEIGADYVLMASGWTLSQGRCLRLADAIASSVAAEA